MTGTKIAAFIGLGMIAISVFLPWAQAGQLTFSGMDGYGTEWLVVAAIGAVIVYFWNRHKELPIAAAVVGGTAFLTGVYDAFNIANIDSAFEGFAGEVEVGIGLYLAIIGGLVAAVAALTEAAQQRKKVSLQVDEEDSRKAA